jgi:hypothetical protein
MRVVLALALVALLAMPAYAKGRKQSPEQQQQDAEKQKRQQETDQAYKSSLGKIPDQKPADPWAPMR